MRDDLFEERERFRNPLKAAQRDERKTKMENYDTLRGIVEYVSARVLGSCQDLNDMNDDEAYRLIEDAFRAIGRKGIERKPQGEYKNPIAVRIEKLLTKEKLGNIDVYKELKEIRETYNIYEGKI